jgi:adenylate kinase family enzyme
MVRMSSVTIYKGTISLFIKYSAIEQYLHKYSVKIPETFAKSRDARDGNEYHMTIVSPSELNKKIEYNLTDLNDKITVLGLGKNDDTFYLICNYPAGDRFRSSLNLEPMDFHITLGFNQKDNHEVNKNIKTLIDVEPDLTEKILSNRPIKGKLESQLEFCRIHNCISKNGIFELAKIYANAKRFDDALLIVEDVKDGNLIKYYFVVLKIKLHKNELYDDYLNSVRKELKEYKTTKTSECDTIIDILNARSNKRLMYFDAEKGCMDFTDIPINYSEIDERVGGSGMINESNITSVHLMGYTDILTLTESPLDFDTVAASKRYNIRFHHFPVRDRHWDNVDLFENIISAIYSAKKALVHCVGGVGRTNTALSAYLIKDRGLSPSEAMSLLTQNRTVKMTGEQIMCLKKYYGIACSVITSDKSSVKLPKMIMMVGAPCSGKTTLSNQFIQRFGDKIVHVNQDDIGKEDCYKFVNDNIKGQKTIVLDRCNVTKKEREQWLSLHDKDTICIYFNYPLDVCKDRLTNRNLHQTLAGKGGIRILEDIYKKIESPSIKEGFVDVFTVNDSDSLGIVLAKFNMNRKTPTDLIKFPRTRHLINIGSASRDDLILDKTEMESFLKNEIYIQEKIDGANMGIFIDDTGIIRVQNRSHFITSAYHTQFKLLDSWLATHNAELRSILLPNRYILFGEWMYAKHSINYTNLPDYFIAYDIFDSQKEAFLSVDRFNDLIDKTDIKRVRTIGKGVYTKSDILDLVTTKSLYYDGVIEGIYLRICKDGFTIDRSKVVRSDFICGDEHWSKNIITRNIVVNAHLL